MPPTPCSPGEPGENNVGGSRRVRSGAEPMDQESAAVISRHSPRSADPEWDNLGTWTPPPVGWMPAGDAFGTDGNGQRENPEAAAKIVATPLLTGPGNHNDFLHPLTCKSGGVDRMSWQQPGRRGPRHGASSASVRPWPSAATASPLALSLRETSKAINSWPGYMVPVGFSSRALPQSLLC